jgi:hypothetical protein
LALLTDRPFVERSSNIDVAKAWDLWHFGNRNTGVRPYKQLLPMKVHLAHCPKETRNYFTKLKGLMSMFLDEPVSSAPSDASRAQFTAAFTDLCSEAYARVRASASTVTFVTFYDRVLAVKRKRKADAMNAASDAEEGGEDESGDDGTAE